jgi:hypothetical protein
MKKMSGFVKFFNMIKARNGTETNYFFYHIQVSFGTRKTHTIKNILKEPISILSFYHKISAPLLHQYYKKHLKKASFLKL